MYGNMTVKLLQEVTELDGLVMGKLEIIQEGDYINIASQFDHCLATHECCYLNSSGTQNVCTTYKENCKCIDSCSY